MPILQGQWISDFEYGFGPRKRRKKFLGVPSGIRVCQFCFQNEEETSFSANSHVIPAAFGNRTLFFLEECECCNKKAGILENSLANSLVLVRAMARSRSGRRGRVKHKPPKGESYIESGTGSNILTVKLIEGERTIRERRIDETTIVYEVDSPRYRPLDVARALARMAVMALPISGDLVLKKLTGWVCGNVK